MDWSARSEIVPFRLDALAHARSGSVFTNDTFDSSYNSEGCGIGNANTMGEHMKVTGLIKFIGTIGCCLFLTAHPLALAEQPPGETVVPVEHATFHQLVFADEDIAILNNFYPPNGDSGLHAHYRDLFYVVIQPSQSSGQNLGEPLTAAPMVTTGTAGYSAIGAEPRIHRVVNGDKSTFHIIVVELRRSHPLGNTASSRDAAPQYVQIVDNPRMRAWRLVLEPGQSAPAITQGNKGIRVVVRGGLLTTITTGLRDQQLALRPGDFAVQPVGTTRALKNSGADTIELVEIELK
jgi:mannose-6-phosphate isomerase-like protein (cupin superfamily)